MPKELVSGYIQKVLRSGSKAIESPQFHVSDSVFEAWESLNSQEETSDFEVQIPAICILRRMYVSIFIFIFIYLHLNLCLYLCRYRHM